MSDLTLVGDRNLVTPQGRPVPRGEYPRIKVPNVRIVGPRLLVLPAVVTEEVTDGGLVIPESARDVTQKGVVLVVGDGVTLPDGTRLEPNCEVGDEIIFARYSGTSLKLERDEFLIIQESDVRAVLTYRGKVFAFADEVAAPGS